MCCRTTSSRTSLATEASDGLDMFFPWRNKTSTALTLTPEVTPTATPQSAHPVTPILSREATSVSWPVPARPRIPPANAGRRDQTPPRLDGGPSPKPQPSAQAHAIELLAWLQKDHLFGGCLLLADDLPYRLYPGFCLSMGWRRRPWNSVARHLRALTGNQKLYKWVEVRTEARRLRVYAIPPLT